MSIIPNYVPSGFKVINVRLTVRDARKAIEWYNRAFGAEEVMRLTTPEGVISHAQLKIADTSFMLTEGDVQGPTGVTMQIFVPDVDAIMEEAEIAGAKILSPAQLQFYGDKCGEIRDPFGHEWLVSTHKESVTASEMQKRFQELF